MRARRIIEGAAFGPETIQVASEAFEAAWSEIAHHFDASRRDAAREMLATSIISATREESSDVDALRRVGIRAMNRAFPDLFPSSPPSDKAEGTGN